MKSLFLVARSSFGPSCDSKHESFVHKNAASRGAKGND